MTYAPKRWPALTRYIDDGRLEIDNRALRGVAIGRRNGYSPEANARLASIPSLRLANLAVLNRKPI
jgi:transposase